jgi:hypothetical protein
MKTLIRGPKALTKALIVVARKALDHHHRRTRWLCGRA